MKKNIYQLVSISLFLVVVGIAVFKGSQLWNDLKNIQLDWAIAGLCVYFMNYILRAERLRIISKQRFRIWPEAIHSASLHGVATYLLPIRTGDLTLPMILKSVVGIGLAEGGQILLKARFLDFVTLGLWMLGASLFTTVSIDLPVRSLWFLLALLISLLPLAVQRLKLKQWLERSGKLRFLTVFESVTAISGVEVLMSLAIWMAVAAGFYCAARAVCLDIGFGGVWFLIAVQLPLQLIPIQGFANAGNHEGGWIAALAILGISASDAVTFALTSHALLLVYVLALGVLAFITGKIPAK